MTIGFSKKLKSPATKKINKVRPVINNAVLSFNIIKYQYNYLVL